MKDLNKIRASKRYNNNLQICKDIVRYELYCIWELFCNNAISLYNVEFVRMLYRCRSKKQIKELILKVI